MAAKKMPAKKVTAKKPAIKKAAAPKKPAAKKSGGRVVPLDYIDQVSGPGGSGTMSDFSGKNAKFVRGKSKITGGGEGPIRASRLYVGGGKLGKEVTFFRDSSERYDKMSRKKR
jgi:hypothetical protein